MVKTIVAKEKLDCEHLLGQFLDERHYDTIINEDTNFFAPPSCGLEEKTSCSYADCSACEKGIDEENVIFVLRKGFFTQKEQDDALEGLRLAARPSHNRGMAAGPRGDKMQKRIWVSEYQEEVLDYFLNPIDNIFGIDTLQEIKDRRNDTEEKSGTRGKVWIPTKMRPINFEFDTWVEQTRLLSKKEQIEQANWVVNEFISDTNYAMPVNSGVAGWYDRYPRIPYGRATAYTEQHFDKFKMAYPLFQKLSKAFSEFLPNRYAFQKSCIDKLDPGFYVPETVFTTITVNRSFRTAAHRDAGDLHQGFSNLCVLSNGKQYSGGMLILPEFRVAVNIQPGDLLLVNNHFGIHGNTPIIIEEKGANRYSIVCYFRENMLELGSKEYEDQRRNFVESRKQNKDHPEWRKLWNGISPGMFSDDCKEWYDFLMKNVDEEVILQNQPKLWETFNSKSISLEDFL